MKKIIAMAMLISMLLTCMTNIGMAKEVKGSMELDFPIDVEEKDASARVGGKEYPIKNATVLFVNGDFLPEASVLIEDEKPLLPIRALAEKLGYKVSWKADERKVTLAKDKSKIELIIDKNTSLVGGKDYAMEKAAKIVNSLTYVPLSFAQKAMGLNVEDTDKMEGLYPKYYESQMPLSPEKTIVRNLRNIIVDGKHEYMDKSSGEEAMKLVQEKCTEGLRNFEKSMRAKLEASKEDPKRFDDVYKDIEREIGRMIFLGEVSKFYKYTIGPYDILFDRTDGKIYFEIYSSGIIIKEMDVNDPDLYSAVFIVG